MELPDFSISQLIYRLPPSAKEELDRRIVVRRVKRGEWVCTPDKPDHTAYYVAEGLLRKYILAGEKEKTKLDARRTIHLFRPDRIG